MTTTLKWNHKNVIPEHDCSVLVLCEWNFGCRRRAIFQADVRAGKEVTFNSYPVIAFAEVNMDEIELGINNDNFDKNFVEFLHNNIKNI